MWGKFTGDLEQRNEGNATSRAGTMYLRIYTIFPISHTLHESTWILCSENAFACEHARVTSNTFDRTWIVIISFTLQINQPDARQQLLGHHLQENHVASKQSADLISVHPTGVSMISEAIAAIQSQQTHNRVQTQTSRHIASVILNNIQLDSRGYFRQMVTSQ